MTDRQKAFTSIILSAFFGGAIGVATKVGLTQIPPLSFAFIRFFIAFLIVLPFALKNKIGNLKTLVPISLLASGNIILFVLGIKTTTATIGQILYAGSPVIVAFATHFFLKEKLKSKQGFGIFLGLVGVFVVTMLPIIEKGKMFSGDLKGNLLITGGVFLWSLYLLMSKKIQKTHSPFNITFGFIFITTLALLPFFIFDLKVSSDWLFHLTTQAIISILYVSILGTIITYLLNQYAIKHAGTVFASMILYLQPIFAFLSAFVILGERLTEGIIIGGFLALLGVFITTKK